MRSATGRLKRAAIWFCCLVPVLGLSAFGIAGCAKSSETLYKEKCAPCHSLTVVENSSYVKSGQWADVVKQMQKKSTSISDSDATAITEYLQKTYPGSK